MTHSLTPELITLEGEQYDTGDVAELLGIDRVDSRFIGRCHGDFTTDEERYLNYKYPELMGLWPILPAVGSLIVKGAGAIGSQIKKAVQKKKAPAKAAAPKVAVPASKPVDAQTLLMQQLVSDTKRQAAAQMAAKEQQQKTLMMIGIPVAVALLLMLIMRR